MNGEPRGMQLPYKRLFKKLAHNRTYQDRLDLALADFKLVTVQGGTLCPNFDYSESRMAAT